MLKKVIFIFAAVFVLPMTVYAETDAESSVVIEKESRHVIFDKECHKRLPMASTTKIMTAVIALENGNSDDIVKVSPNAQNQEGSSVYLRAGDEVKLEDLLYAMMLNSGNDAATAIAEHIGGNVENFVTMMNDKACELGCNNTHFCNPSGLNEAGHYSSAYDLALMTAYAAENDLFREIVSAKYHRIINSGSVTYLKNHNKLLWQYDRCVGGKTGFTKASGRCLVTFAEKDGKSTVAVTLNDSNDWFDHKVLHESAFDLLEKRTILTKGTVLCRKTIRGKRIDIIAGDNAEIVCPKNGGMKLRCRIFYNEKINKSAEVGEIVGVAVIYGGDYRLLELPAVCGSSIADPFKTFGKNMAEILDKMLLKY